MNPVAGLCEAGLTEASYSEQIKLTHYPYS